MPTCAVWCCRCLVPLTFSNLRWWCFVYNTYTGTLVVYTLVCNPMAVCSLVSTLCFPSTTMERGRRGSLSIFLQICLPWAASYRTDGWTAGQFSFIHWKCMQSTLNCSVCAPANLESVDVYAGKCTIWGASGPFSQKSGMQQVLEGIKRPN